MKKSEDDKKETPKQESREHSAKFLASAARMAKRGGTKRSSKR